VKTFVDVILPLPLDRYFTYSLSPVDEDKVVIGSRVVVPFGTSKSYTAVVAKIHNETPKDFKIKSVTAVLDQSSIVRPYQLEFWQWIANYYLCTVGDVFKAALPSGLKVESETIVELNESHRPDDESLSETEKKILEVLNDVKHISVKELQKGLSEKKSILPVIRSLIESEAIIVSENLKDNYHPKLEIRVRLKDEIDEDRLQKLFVLMKQAPKQVALLMKYVELSGILKKQEPKVVSKKELLAAAEVQPGVLKALIDKNIFETYTEDIGRLDTSEQAVSPYKELNTFQQTAYQEIRSCFDTKNVCLLHGVTSSGKTEIYIHLIAETIKAGKQALYLLPEIALTTQITHRLKQVFGTRIGIYHSKFPDAERVEIWRKQLSEEPYDVILGVRSSIFLPYRNLGLIIVDEEHETTYKQQDPAPRYHARNAAIVLASYQGAKTLLGTATPSIESWYNAQSGKYGIVSLSHRFQDIKLPEIVPVDMKEMRRTRQVNGIFSFELIKHISTALQGHEQIILFQNRRGFAPMIMCHTCGWVPRCVQCDVSLTYHKRLHQLTCHYCGYTIPVPAKCPACDSTELNDRGFGTEKIEDGIQEIFPAARVARMDLDTTRSRSSYEKIISKFENKEIDILIGTQMISKGLDFDNVSIVGILDADSMLNYPDFRSYERSFQLMAQVAGRSGRKEKQGLVIVQTLDVKQPIMKQVMRHDYEGMVNVQLEERQLFRYPPFCHLIYVYLKHRDEKQVELLSRAMSIALRREFGERVIGPDKPPVGRIQQLFIRKIVLKIELTASISDARSRLRRIEEELMKEKEFKSCIVYYDVDPM